MKLVVPNAFVYAAIAVLAAATATSVLAETGQNCIAQIVGTWKFTRDDGITRVRVVNADGNAVLRDGDTGPAVWTCNGNDVTVSSADGGAKYTLSSDGTRMTGASRWNGIKVVGAGLTSQQTERSSSKCAALMKYTLKESTHGVKGGVEVCNDLGSKMEEFREAKCARGSEGVAKFKELRAETLGKGFCSPDNVETYRICQAGGDPSRKFSDGRYRIIDCDGRDGSLGVRG